MTLEFCLPHYRYPVDFVGHYDTSLARFCEARRFGVGSAGPLDRVRRRDAQAHPTASEGRLSSSGNVHGVCKASVAFAPL